MNQCQTLLCEQPKEPGRGKKFCPGCKAESVERRRLENLRRSAEYRQEHPEKARVTERAYYLKTADRQKARARAWHHANPERVAKNRLAAKERPRPRVKKYGLSQADYSALFAAQGGCCAICGRTENGKRRFFDVDHDHTDGTVRGLLCNRCNRMLSNARDDVALLTKAIDYLSPQRATEVA